MKKTTRKWILPLITLLWMIVFTTCTEMEDFADKGSKAAVEFCNCYQNNSKEKCLENLKDKYKASEYESDEFIKSFNKASTCNIELIKQYTQASSIGKDSSFMVNLHSND